MKLKNPKSLLFAVGFVVFACQNQVKPEATVNVEQLESVVIEQTISDLMKRVPTEPYGLDPIDQENISEFSDRSDSMKAKFNKLITADMNFFIIDELSVPDKDEVSKYKRILNRDFFKFLTNDTTKAKSVDISNVNKVGDFSVVQEIPENSGTENISDIGFMGFAFYSRIQFNSDHSLAQFIFTFSGGYWQYHEFAVKAKLQHDTWRIISVKEL